jgi:hypothetical protein
LRSEEGPLSERLLNNFVSSVRRHIANGFLSLTYDVRAEAARHPDLHALLVSKDSQILNRIVDLMKSTDLVNLSDEALYVRAEQICLLFEGMIARIVRHAEFDPANINTLIRPLLTVILSCRKDDVPPAADQTPSRRRL